MKKSEKEVENEILAWLQMCPGLYWKNNSVGIYDRTKGSYRRPSKYHINGTSDVLGVFPDGRFVAIEVKSQRGKVSESQDLFLKAVVKNGGIALIARSLEDVQQRFKEEFANS